MSYSSPQIVEVARAALSVAELQAADRAAWRRLYRTAPDVAIWHPLPFLTELVEAIRPLPGLPLVDLCCGDGGQISGLPTELEMVGVDQSGEALDRAAIRTANRGNTRFVEALAESTGLADESAGGAVLIDILSSFLDPATVLREAHRILAPGAALAITTFTPADPLALLHRAIAAEPVRIGDFINVFYEPNQVEQLLTGAGLEVESSSTRRDPEGGHPAFRDDRHDHARAIVIGRKRRS